MPSRRHHTKNRHGCKQCKDRRVKCNTGAPCQHCTRRQEHCSNTSGLPDEVSVDSVVHTSLASPCKVKRISSVETDIKILGITYLEWYLLDHYCNSVAPIISPHHQLQRMWQYGIPQEAKTHSFLKHSMMSTSAYHLYCVYSQPLPGQHEKSPDLSCVGGDSIQRVSPERRGWQKEQSDRYERLALEQQRLALHTYIPSLCAITSDNQEALCAASALLSLNSIASTQSRYRSTEPQFRSSSPVDDWLEISLLCRGVDAVVQNAGGSILDGVMQPLLCPHRIEPSSEEGIESQVKRLVSPHVLSALNALTSAIDHHTSSKTDKEILHSALGLLKVSFAIVAANPEHESIVMVWSNLLDVTFFPLVKRREPMALVLLAYWTVALRTFKARWWVGGLSTTILRHIAGILTRLDEGTEEGYCKVADDLIQRCSDEATGSMAGKAKWRDLLDWLLRENDVGNA